MNIPDASEDWTKAVELALPEREAEADVAWLLLDTVAVEITASAVAEA